MSLLISSQGQFFFYLHVYVNEYFFCFFSISTGCLLQLFFVTSATTNQEDLATVADTFSSKGFSPNHCPVLRNNSQQARWPFSASISYLTLPLFLVGHDVGYYGPPFFPVGSNFCASVYVHSCISGDVSQPSASLSSSTAFSIYHAFCDYTL